MDKFIISGGKELKGAVLISGAKNSILPIMVATIIAPGKYRLNNVPKLKDTFTMKRLLEMVGAKVNFNENVMDIDTSGCNKPVAPYELVKTMRASFYVLGPFMSRFNYAEVSLPGGCAWGPRPVDFHLEALEKMGAELELSDGMIITKGKLTGAEIEFKKSSVGATGNTIMAAVTAKGKTIIRNAAEEPEIAALCIFLNEMGADIESTGKNEIIINGQNDLHADIEYTVIPDRIEASTFLIAAAITKSNIKLKCVNPIHMKIVLEYLQLAGMKLDIGHDTIQIIPNNSSILPVDIKTGIYPGFPTDVQAQWMALMTQANGSSVITENIYTDRFTHIPELSRFGANIRLDKNKAILKGSDRLIAAPVMSTDIRASASLILAALAAKGKSTISRIYHIDRGYENIEKKLSALGAEITREKSIL